MDPIRNPFSPGAGSPPPELVGRDPVLRQADTLLGRVKLGRPEKSLLLTGLRGVGKTVLLNEIARHADDAGYRTFTVEATEGKSLAATITPGIRKILFDLDRLAGAGEKVRTGLRTLKSFLGAFKISSHDVTFSLDIAPEQGSADSGDLETDMSSLFVAVAEAAVERQTAVGIFIDEIQSFTVAELGALVMGMHRIQQRQLPLVFVGAGLPILPALLGEAKSYAERLFSFPSIGALSETDAARALQDPAQQEGISFDADALAKVFRQTKGYPYFVQEWGYQSWNHAQSSPISLEIVRGATAEVIPRLDENFFRVRFDRLTLGEKNFLRAMAQLGEGGSRMGDVAAVLRVKVTSLSPTREKLIRKGMVYSPIHGDIAFTVPLFDQFMKRAIPNFPA